MPVARGQRRRRGGRCGLAAIRQVGRRALRRPDVEVLHGAQRRPVHGGRVDAVAVPVAEQEPVAGLAQTDVLPITVNGNGEHHALRAAGERSELVDAVGRAAPAVDVTRHDLAVAGRGRLGRPGTAAAARTAAPLAAARGDQHPDQHRGAESQDRAHHRDRPPPARGRGRGRLAPGRPRPERPGQPRVPGPSVGRARRRGDARQRDRRRGDGSPQRPGECVGRAEAPGRIAVHRLLDRPGERRRDRGDGLQRPVDAPVGGPHHGQRRGTGERRHAGERPVADHRQRVDVGPGVGLGTVEQLGGQVLGRAADVVAGDAAERPGDAEVAEQRLAVGREQHVGRLDVTVEDAAPMGRGQGVGDRGRHGHDLARGQRRPFEQQVLERAARRELHGQPRRRRHRARRRAPGRCAGGPGR